MIGRTLGNRYEILEKIDSGGMAYVFKARCKKTSHIVAVKILKQKFSESSEYVNRFKKEAQAAFSVEHQHVVHVMDVGFDNGVYYMVMEYISGPSLRALIDENKSLEENIAIEYTIQICSALFAAHKKGIVHRDIKPSNILTDEEGMIKVTDFGIAKSVTSIEEKENHVIGSVYYISPEQARGDRVDARSDIYSLGIVLYEMLTGVKPFSGDKTVSVALKHINEQIVPPDQRKESISKAVNNIVLKATSKNKRNRYRSMKEFRDDLMLALVDKDGDFVAFSEQKTHIKRTRDPKKNKIWKVATLCILGVIVSAVIFIGAGAIKSNGPLMIDVPNEIGKTINSATIELKGLELIPEITYEVSNTFEEGVVVTQSPEADTKLTQGGVIYLTISSGPDDLVMPDVNGLTESEAVSIVGEMGLSVEDIVYEEKNDVLPGIVIMQVPEPGEAVNEDDSINLAISKESEPDMASMPQVVGETLDQTVGLLSDSGFVNVFVYQEENDADPGIVISQTPEQGTQVPYNVDVDLWISKYEGKKYSGSMQEEIQIPENGSKIKIVAEEFIGGYEVNFILDEDNRDAGTFLIDLPIECISGGTKKIKVYVNNNVEEIFKVDMTERSNLGEG